MKKLFLFLVFTLTSIQLIAANQNSHNFHAPHFQEQIFNQLKQHGQDKNTSIIVETIGGGLSGAILAFAAAFELGVAVSSKIIPGSNNAAQRVGAIVGGSLTTTMFSPLAFVAAIPGTAIGTGCGLVSGLYRRVRARCIDNDFNREVSLNLYQWIDLIKKGHLSIKEDVNISSINSISLALNNILNETNFKRYFGDSNISEQQLKELFDKVSQEQDTIENFFLSLSEQVKCSDLTEQQWKTLSNKLISFRNASDFPGLSIQEIHDYRYFAVYFFLAAHKDHKAILYDYLT